MTQTENNTVVGIFDNSHAVRGAINALTKAGFTEEQIGFAARTQKEHLAAAQQQLQQHGHNLEHTSNSVIRGIVGGVLGAIDLLLVPFAGPAVATNALATALPVTEEAIDHLPYLGASEEQPAPALDETVRNPATTVPPVTTQPTTSTTGTESSVANEEIEQRHSRITGGVTGGVIGGVLGAATALLLPDIGPVIAGGIIAAILGGGAIGSVAGSFLGTFDTLGIPEEHARHYTKAIKSGHIIVTIQNTDHQQEASTILQTHGAHEVYIHA
ncbi:hypothetical protein ccbrp13_40980 [Ktedonobacteria bacterium brp13]|nr:hypothetical protein ccbrp13_40980 [Ktedonobacteria bacterium brp13]